MSADSGGGTPPPPALAHFLRLYAARAPLSRLRLERLAPLLAVASNHGAAPCDLCQAAVCLKRWLELLPPADPDYQLAVVKELLKILDAAGSPPPECLYDIAGGALAARRHVSDTAAVVRHFCLPPAGVGGAPTFSIREAGVAVAHGTTGLTVWKASLAALGHMVQPGGALSSARRVLELGAGVGLLSAAAGALRGAGDPPLECYVATDGSEHALRCCRENVLRNGLAPRRHLVGRLDWRSAEADYEALGVGGVDLVLAADVCFDPPLLRPLARALSHVLRRNPAAAGLLFGTLRNRRTLCHFITCLLVERVQFDLSFWPNLDLGTGASELDEFLAALVPRQDVLNPCYVLRLRRF